MPIIIKGGKRFCLFGEEASSSVSLVEGKWTMKSDPSSRNVFLCVGPKYVNDPKEGCKGVCVCVGADKFVCGPKECSIDKGLCLSVDTSKAKPEAQGVCLCLDGKKWICRPKSPTDKVVICVGAADDQGKVCVAVGEDRPEKCQSVDVEIEDVCFCTSSDWVCKAKEDDSVQDVCIYLGAGQCQTLGIADPRCICICIATDKCVCGLGEDPSDQGICVSIGGGEMKQQGVCVCVGAENCGCEFKEDSLGVCACVGVGKCLCRP